MSFINHSNLLARLEVRNLGSGFYQQSSKNLILDPSVISLHPDFKVAWIKKPSIIYSAFVTVSNGDNNNTILEARFIDLMPISNEFIVKIFSGSGANLIENDMAVADYYIGLSILHS